MTEHLRQGFLLGEYRVHPPTGTITGPDGTHHAPPTMMDLLVFFAQHPDRLLSREELIQAVWNGSESADAALTRCIADLRRHFDDHPDNPRYIQTLPRRGYRLLASVNPLAADSTPAPVTTKASYQNFFAELRRRRVIRVGIVYLVASWLIVQVAQTTFPALLLPAWSVTLVVTLVAIGFPIALILSWAYQVEAEGRSPTATTVHYIVDKNRKLDFAVIAALAVAVVVLGYQLIDRDPPDRAGTSESGVAASAVAPARPSIAVLPFKNMSDDPQNEYFSDGLSEEILNLLARMRVVDVAARTSSFYFKDKDVDIKTIAGHLGVTNVLEGSVRRDGEKVRITAQLINAETGFHLWSSTFDKEMKDIFSIQDDIARQVVEVLEIVLSKDSEAALARIPTHSVEAYEYYLRGRDYLRGEKTERQLERARLLFENAVDLDADFAEAHAGLCDAYLSLYDRSRSTDFFEKAERSCHRGLILDSGAGDVYVALGNLYRYSGQYEKAIDNYQRAIAINAKDVTAYGGLADTYKLQNLLDKAEQNFQRVIDIQPGYWRGYLEMGGFLYFSGRFNEAVDAYSKVVQLAPDNATGYLNLGSSYYLLGEFERAAEAWNQSLQIAPSTSAYMNVGSSYFFLGRFDDAADMYRKATELSPEDFEVWGSLGDAIRYSDKGPEQAAEAYRKAITLGEMMLKINASDAQTMAMLSQYYAQLGDEARAKDLITQAQQLQPQNIYVQYSSALTHASIGEKELAMKSIEKAVELGYPAALLKMDAGLREIADSERFMKLLRQNEQPTE